MFKHRIWIAVLFGFSGPALHAETVTYVHTDALGSVVLETNSAGANIRATDYRAYGDELLSAPQRGPAFAGHYRDIDSGLVYMQQRYYDSVAGRFLSVDPVGVTSTTGANFSRYSYASNKPYTFVDPDGRVCISIHGNSTCIPEGEEGRGLPIVSFPTPEGWPTVMSSDKFPNLYHRYRYGQKIGRKSADSVRKSVIKDPTPNDNDRPATPGGTPNDATPSKGFRNFFGSKVNNDVRSYTFKDKDGVSWEINVTEPSHTLAPGYVLRGVAGDELISYGEGIGWKQMFGPVSDFTINDVWLDQNQQNVDSAE